MPWILNLFGKAGLDFKNPNPDFPIDRLLRVGPNSFSVVSTGSKGEMERGKKCVSHLCFPYFPSRLTWYSLEAQQKLLVYVRSVTTYLAVTLPSFGITTVIWITLTVTLDTVDTVVGINTRFVIARFAGLFREEKVLMLRITLTETKRGMRSAKTKQFINPLSKSEIERLKRWFFLPLGRKV